jgi:hypothetical protein
MSFFQKKRQKAEEKHTEEKNIKRLQYTKQSGSLGQAWLEDIFRGIPYLLRPINI